jgi:predicted transcriptional regulator
MQKLTVRFSDEEYENLSKIAQQKERSFNELVREALREYVKRESKD